MPLISLYDKFRDKSIGIIMSIFSSYKKIFLLGFIVIILIAIPLSVYIAQQSQQTKSKASASTTLSFEPASQTVNTGDTLTLNIVLDPGTGATANQVSFVKLSISFDPKKFTTITKTATDESLMPNPTDNTLTTTVDDPKYDNTAGKATISLSIGADPTKVVQQRTTIAILKLKATAETTPTAPNIKFDSAPDTQVLSIASGDQTSENVLSTTTPATVTVNPATNSDNPTVTPTATPTPTPTPTPLPGSASLPTSTPTPTNLGTESAVLTPTPIIAQPPPAQVLPPTGPGEKIVRFGVLGTVLTIVGGLLFISL